MEQEQRAELGELLRAGAWTYSDFGFDVLISVTAQNERSVELFREADPAFRDCRIGTTVRFRAPMPFGFEGKTYLDVKNWILKKYYS